MSTASEQLRHDHGRLQRALAELRNAADGADQATLASAWTELERVLDRHLDAEEQWLLPRLQRRHPREVRQVREEHVAIRRLVAELGVRADLRTLRKDVADALATLLEQHAAREERGIYSFADAELEPPHKIGLLEALSRRAGGVL